MAKINYGIIAAGEGSRLVKEGVVVPKPLVALNGMIMIKRLIDIFVLNDAKSISIIVNEEMTEVQEYLRNLTVKVPLNIIVKSTPSSMHSFYELRNFLKDEKFCLTTVDTIFREEDFSKFIQAFIADTTSDGIMAVTDYIDDEKPLYISVNKENMMIQNFLDESNTCKYISGGIYALTPKAIKVLEYAVENGQTRMRNFQRQLIQDGLQLKAYPFSKIIDVDHVDDIKKAEIFLDTRD